MTSGVIVSDLHLGDYSYGQTDPETGLNTRFLDILHNLDQSVDFAIEHKVNFYFVVGDIYRNKHPNSKIRKQFAPRVAKLVKAGIRVIVMTGNHDMTTSADGAHAMSEMEELCELIPGLQVFSSPTVVEIDDTSLYILPFVNRGEHNLLTVNELLRFQVDMVKEYNLRTKKQKSRKNLFFGHFGTDKSVVGGSFDLDMSSEENENIVTVDAFSEGKWTAVYLGHIHKQQELTKNIKHVGSLGRIDFAEEKEIKGFYHYHDGIDEFVPVVDRKFKTFKLVLDENHKEQLADFLQKIKKLDLAQTIVRVKAEIKQTYMSEIRLNEAESYLKSHSWHSLGIDIDLVGDEVKKIDAQQITTIDTPDEALKKFIEQHSGQFKGIEDKALNAGVEILKAVRAKAK